MAEGADVALKSVQFNANDTQYYNILLTYIDCSRLGTHMHLQRYRLPDLIPAKEYLQDLI